MSESDDSDLLADIEALDDALKTKSQPYVSSSQRFNTPDVDEFDNNDYSEYLYANREIDDSLNAYEINARLITGLTIAKRKLIALLEQCELKIKLVDEKMGKSRNESGSSSKLAISNAGMPYFKDKDYFSAPQNEDTKTKERRGELYMWSLTRPSRWTGRDRETLLSAISNQAIESVLCGGFSKEIKASTSDNRARTTKLVLPRNFNEMVGALGERDFDWYKISAMDFDGKHSPGECKAMWNVYLHPQFRKNEWTSAEDKKLQRCVREYRCQNWDAIMRKLDTNRSAYQCFIRYNTIKKVPSTGRIWTRQEDKHLMKLMNVIRIGDYIPWTDIANHMRHRTKQQIYVRWMYRKAPHLKKGRFTYMETSNLLKAVQKYGLNFCKISSVVMPNRTSTQLQERYYTVMGRVNNWNVWSDTDDMLLISLHLKHNNDWSKIATYFSDKTRTQVRHRYNALLRYAMRGVSIENMPRQSSSLISKKINKKTLSKKALRIRNKISSEMHKMQRVVSILDIQLRLYETLCFPPSIRPNNSEEEPYGIEQLACNTKRLCNTLNLLNANLDIPDDFVNYVQLSNREKQLLVSLKEHVNVRNVSTQDNELVEKFRMRMFGYAEVSESDFFIPPFPFDGYVKIKKVRNRRNSSIDYDLDVSEEFLVEMPANFSITSCVLPFISIAEEIQFHKLGQFLIRDYQDCGQQNVGLYNSIECILSFADSSTSDQILSGYDQSSVNSKIPLEDYEQTEVNKLRETFGVKDDEVNLSNIILPNQATLLGLKNLLLWKLLYDCQHESHVQCELMASLGGETKSEQTATNSRSARTGSAEYQLLRTRLLQLFKLPIGLSNTILQIHGPEAIFSVSQKKKQNTSKIIVIATKRKSEEESDGNSLQRNETNDSVVSGNSDSQLDSDVATENPLSRLRKRYKTTRK